MINSLVASIIIAFSSNTGGGRINLTDERGSCQESEWVAFAYNSEGNIATGCWTYSQGLVLVSWDMANGKDEKRIYEADSFLMTPEAAALK